MTYFIIFACYGCHLHGSESGSVDRLHNLPGSRVLESNPPRTANERQLMDHASRRLNQQGLDESGRKRWARHGSTRWLWKQENVAAAIRYVVDEQDRGMAVFERLER